MFESLGGSATAGQLSGPNSTGFMSWHTVALQAVELRFACSVAAESCYNPKIALSQLHLDS